MASTVYHHLESVLGTVCRRAMRHSAFPLDCDLVSVSVNVVGANDTLSWYLIGNRSSTLPKEI